MEFADDYEYLPQFEFGSVPKHSSLIFGGSEGLAVYDFSTQEFLGRSCAADVWPHYYGHLGFKSGDGKVILKKLGRVSYTQEVL